MNRARLHKTALPAAIALAFIAYAHAGSLTKGVHFILGSQNAPASFEAPRISLYPGKVGFSGIGNVGTDQILTPVNESISGSIVDYNFFRESPTKPNTLESFLDGGKGLINVDGLNIRTDLLNRDSFQFWVATDPGANYSSKPDYSSDTLAGSLSNVWGSVSLDELTSGTVYFFYDNYRAKAQWSATMKDTDGSEPDVVLPLFGDDDHANNHEYYVASIDFVNDTGAYDTIEWTFTSSKYIFAPHCSFSGIILVGEQRAPATIIYGE